MITVTSVPMSQAVEQYNSSHIRLPEITITIVPMSQYHKQPGNIMKLPSRSVMTNVLTVQPKIGGWNSFVYGRGEADPCPGGLTLWSLIAYLGTPTSPW